MNKKILSLFLVVAASAILAISCNNKSTNPTTAASSGKELDIKLADSSKGTEKTPVAITLSAKQSSDDTKLKAEAVATDAITLDGKDKDLDGLKLTVVSVADDKTVTGQDLEDKKSGFSANGKGFSIGADKKIKISKDTEITGNTDFGNGKKAGLKITVRASKDGYAPKDITVYALGTINRAD